MALEGERYDGRAKKIYEQWGNTFKATLFLIYQTSNTIQDACKTWRLNQALLHPLREQRYQECWFHKRSRN